MSHEAVGAPAGPLTLIDVLGTRAQEEPNRRAYTFVADGEVESGHLTYGDLERQARAIASRAASISPAARWRSASSHSNWAISLPMGSPVTAS